MKTFKFLFQLFWANYMCRILRDSNDQCEDISLDDGPNFSDLSLLVFGVLSKREVSQNKTKQKKKKKGKYCDVAELTVSVFMYHIECSYKSYICSPTRYTKCFNE